MQFTEYWARDNQSFCLVEFKLKQENNLIVNTSWLKGKNIEFLEELWIRIKDTFQETSLRDAEVSFDTE